jgi:TolB-like protein/DNA-binding SARP family transcriptional activator/Flp pilus assembly protein TadD
VLMLRLFGAAVLEGPEGPMRGRAAKSHRLALLALLALARGRPMTRDKLIALLWPESSTQRARHQLSDTLYMVRAALGEDLVRSIGDELLLNHEAIESDVEMFERLLDEGCLETAVELVGGPLLDGFHLSNSAEFEDWLEAERARLGHRDGAALEALAEAAEREQNFWRAAEWWKTRAAHDPYDSRIALRLIQALIASGNRGGALQHFATHHRLLRAEFGVAPPPELRALSEQLRREPLPETPTTSRPSEIRRNGEPPSAAPRDEEPAASARADSGLEESGAPPSAALVQGRSGPRSKRWGVLAPLTLVSFLGAVWVWSQDSGPEPSIVVLPFVNVSSDEENEYFSDGLTEEIITRLSTIPELKVISRTSAMHYKRSDRSLGEIAEELNVAHILEGSVRQSDGRVRISAQLIDARSDQHLWAQNFEYELRDMFRVQEEIAREVVNALEIELGDRGLRRLARQGTRDPEAYELYRRGRYLWNTRPLEAHEQAIDYYRRAIQRDPGYSDAYAGLADVYLTAYQLNLSNTPEAEAFSRFHWAAERALTLDDESADAHALFGLALLWRGNWSGAARELRRALELNPSHPTARSWYSLLLSGSGRLEEALDESHRALELDPFSIVVSCNYGWLCYVARDYDCAIEQYRNTLEIAPMYARGNRGLGLAYAQRGMISEAIKAFRTSGDLAPEFLGDLAYGQALAGRREDAMATLSRAKAHSREGSNIARAYVALGQPDSAFAWLERSSWQWPHRASLYDPALDPLRSDPRFAQTANHVERAMGVPLVRIRGRGLSRDGS